MIEAYPRVVVYAVLAVLLVGAVAAAIWVRRMTRPPAPVLSSSKQPQPPGGKPARAPAQPPAPQQQADRPRVVFSMTTTPERFEHVHETVESLLKSAVRPDAVYLHLPAASRRTGEPYPEALGDELERLQAVYGERLRVNRVQHDVGPLTKLHPTLALETDADTRIITADDDELYPPHYHDELLRQSLAHPEWVVAYRGLEITDVRRGAYEFVNGGDGLQQVHVVEGYTGVVYRRQHFRDDFVPPEDDCACVTTDDVWVSAYLAGRGVPRVLIGGGLPMGDARGLGNAAHPMQPRNHVAAISPLFEKNHSAGDRNARCIRASWRVIETIPVRPMR